MGNIFKIQCVATGKVLDVPGGSLDSGVIIQQYEDNGGTNQKWELDFVGISFGQNVYKMVSEASHKVLDAPGGNLDDQVKIQQYDDNGGTNQMWSQIPVGDGSYTIKSVATQKVLDVPSSSHDNGVQIQQYHDHGGSNQHWYFIEVSPE